MDSPKTIPQEKFQDSLSKSVLKTLSWRVIGTLDTILISFFITDKFSLAMSIGLIELFTKMLLYFFHERIWNRITLNKH
jgi:uncharacterized membrane protein